MASQGAKIERANFSTTPYHYQERASSFAYHNWYWFYKSNVCWDVYIYSPARAYLRLDFYDYDTNEWIPFTSTAGTYYGYSYMWSFYGEIFRFFHNCLHNYNNSSYTADIKEKDNTNLTYNGYKYDTRGFSLWRIGFCFNAISAYTDFNINSFGPGYLTSEEYNAVCKGRLIYCGGKCDVNSDDQHIVSGSYSDSDFNTRFLPSLWSGYEIKASLDRQCIPDWRWAKTQA